MKKSAGRKIITALIIAFLPMQVFAQNKTPNEQDLFNMTRSVKPKIIISKPSSKSLPPMALQAPLPKRSEPVINIRATQPKTIQEAVMAKSRPIIKPPTNTTVKTQIKKQTEKPPTTIIAKKPLAVIKQPAAIAPPLPRIQEAKPVKVINSINSTTQVRQVEQPYKKNISLNDRVAKYGASYDDTYMATLSGLLSSGLKLNYYDSESGMVTGSYGSKELIVYVVPVDENSTMVRITPADGVYSTESTQFMFDNIYKSFKLNATAKAE